MLYIFFNDTATTEIYTLSLHDALPISTRKPNLIMGGAAGPRSAALAARWADEYNIIYPTVEDAAERRAAIEAACEKRDRDPDRKSTRLNSSHANISYAVFCLKKKNISQ